MQERQEELVIGVSTKLLYCPDCGIETTHVYEGKWHWYSAWRCMVCERVILGEPIGPPHTL